MFVIKNVSKKYGDEFALRNASFELGRGMNFIVGPSGSGKTTLLKIISSMEENYEGEVFYNNISMKSLGGEDKSYLYNNTFGFVWQDFNLIEDLTVLENISIPYALKDKKDSSKLIKILKVLKISNLAHQKVKTLSGGQKQRVAIAREFVKNPQVIIADEPTSALDEKTSKETMEILREISKTRIVIVVTHDTSLIKEKDKVYELDKGELISKSKDIIKNTSSKSEKQSHKLSFKNALQLALINFKRAAARSTVSIIALLLASVLLLISISGVVKDSGDSAFKELFDTYGEGILDISVIDSFTSAAGTDGKEEGPKGEVNQDIEGLYDKYIKDDRVQHVLFLQSFDEITVAVDNKKINVESSGNVPVLNKLTAGNMPNNDKNEVVVPSSLAKKMGMKDEDIIGKELVFDGKIYNWDSGSPVLMPVSIKATIAGVADTTMKYEYEGKVYEATIEDSFFFSKRALDEVRKQGKSKEENMDFIIRAKNPEAMISLVDELNANGIVPIGQFELVEDIVRVNKDTTNQSSTVTVAIGILAGIVAVAIALITAIIRRREYAIYKVSGFNNKQLVLEAFAEFFLAALGTIIAFLVSSPAINLVTRKTFNLRILSGKFITIGILLIILMAIISLIVTSITAVKTNVSKELKTGEK